MDSAEAGVVLRRRLEYYKSVLPKRGPGYAALKARVIPQIHRALEKIHNGSYGFCDDCGVEISKARLESVPGAIRCRSCQEIKEEEK